MKKTIIAMFGASLLTLCGCFASAGEVPQSMTGMKNSSDVGIMAIGGMCEVDTGYFLELGDGKDVQVGYFDYETGLLVPFCTRVDCGHTRDGERKSNCTACILADASASSMCVYEDKIWYLSGDYEDRMMLCQADLTGENARELFAIDTDFCSGNIVLYDGFLYMRTENANVDAFGVWDGDLEGLVRVDLETGQHEWVEEETLAYLRSYRIIGFAGSRLYYQYYAGAKYPNGAVAYYDCATGEKGAIEARDGELMVAEMNDSHLVYMGKAGEQEYLAIIDLESGEEIDRFAQQVQADLHVGPDGFIMEKHDQGFFCYDFAEQELTYWEKPVLAEYIWIFHCFETGYLCQVVDEGSGALSEYAYLSKEAFRAGEMPVILTEDELPIG